MLVYEITVKLIGSAVHGSVPSARWHDPLQHNEVA